MSQSPSSLLLRRLAVVATVAVTALTAAPGAARAEPAGTAEPTSTIVDTARGTGAVVSLTFDDGPNPADTPRLLQVLRRHDVKAVFCLWGDYVVENPQIVRRIVAAGHTLCNHTLHHDDLTTLTPQQIRGDLAATSALIRSVAPGVRIPYFRAPYGSWGESPEIAADLGMQPLGWRLTISDWEPPGTDVLVQRLRDGITPGAVVLLHDGPGDRSQTVEAVDTIIPELRAQGWRFTLPQRPGAGAS